MIDDSRKDIAIKILNNEFGVNPMELKRFTSGYCHSVYYVKFEKDEFALRITGKDNKEYYLGSIKWLSELIALDIPVPKLIKHGQYNDVYFTIISFINGKDLGEVYSILNDSQKQIIVKNLSEIQKKVATIPTMELYGYPYSGNNNSFSTWIKYLESLIKRSFERISKNNIFNKYICNDVTNIMYKFKNYFLKIKPIAFLDDITTKNVLIHEGKLSGIVDIDEICFGDSLLVIGLTNMALLAMKTDTKYTDYWLDEIKANEIQREVVIFYTLLFCIDFMSEQGMQFDNDKNITYNQKTIENLNCICNELIVKCNGNNI